MHKNWYQSSEELTTRLLLLLCFEHTSGGSHVVVVPGQPTITDRTMVRPLTPHYSDVGTASRGDIVFRTHDIPKNPYIPLLLHTIFGPDYY